jgi:hypothetical protein
MENTGDQPIGDTWIEAFSDWFRIAFERVAAARVAYRRGDLETAVDEAMSAAQWCKLAYLASEHLASLYRTMRAAEQAAQRAEREEHTT